MPAFIISRTNVKNPDLMKEYASKSIPLAISHGGKYIVRTNNVEALDGSYDGPYYVIMEFPDVKERARFLGFSRVSKFTRNAPSLTDTDAWLVWEGDSFLTQSQKLNFSREMQ